MDCYIDDGRAGSSFERSGFQHMIEDIESGRINTVICKDLSRFGRNYYEAGIYLDKYFVQKDIRFIAPGDNTIHFIYRIAGLPFTLSGMPHVVVAPIPQPNLFSRRRRLW